MADLLDKNETARLIASDKVEGTSVYNREGDKLGTIRKIMIGKRSGNAECAILEFGGIFGIGGDHYPLPWKILECDTEKGGYVIDMNKEKLESAPKFNADDTPEYTDEYGRTIFGYYGVSYPLL